MSKAKYLVLSCAIIALCLSQGFLAMPAYAGEFYGSHYPGGNEDFLAGALPPAGTNIFLNYLVDYNFGTIKDNAGRASVVPTPAGNLPLKVDFNVLVDALRFVRVTKVSLLGGDLVVHGIIPFGDVHGSVQAVLPNGSTAYAPAYPSERTSLGDVEFGAGIAWHPSKTFHHVFAVDVVAPTGTYAASSAGGSSSHTFIVDHTSLGRNYWSFNPLWALTYLGDKDSPIPGLELSAKLMYWINTVNTATSYVSGQEFSADYLVGYHINKELAFGANGFFLYQTTKDKQFGATAIDPITGLQTGLQARRLSVGPAITWELPNKLCTLTFKYQHDVYSYNTAEGNTFWLKLIYTF